MIIEVKIHPHKIKFVKIKCQIAVLFFFLLVITSERIALAENVILKVKSSAIWAKKYA